MVAPECRFDPSWFVDETAFAALGLNTRKARGLVSLNVRSGHKLVVVFNFQVWALQRFRKIKGYNVRRDTDQVVVKALVQ